MTLIELPGKSLQIREKEVGRVAPVLRGRARD